MPLDKSGTKDAFSRNVATEINAGKKKDQALAVAFAVGRRKRAAGGQLGPGAFNIQPKQMVRNEARQMTHAGPIISTVPGRTDHIPMAVKSGGYMIPAQAVSHLGQSNTLAGHAVINAMFSHDGPYGAGAVMKMGHGQGAPKPGKLKLATGGASDHGGGKSDGSPTDIIAAGGEHFLNPEEVRAVSIVHGGKGDLEFAHKLLDKWVMDIQKKHAATISKLPRPARD